MADENNASQNEPVTGLPQDRPQKRGLPGWPSSGCLGFGVACLILLFCLNQIFLSGFWESQYRSKVARAQSDMRALGEALEAYAADQKAYPPHVQGIPVAGALAKREDGADATATFAARPDGSEYLVSPKNYMGIAAYMTAMPFDIFAPIPKTRYGYYTTGKSWVLFSTGPDLVYDVPDPSRLPAGPSGDLDPKQFLDLTYDATNGTKSRGDIFRFGGKEAVR